MVTSLDWVTYPILRFKDAPKIHLDVQSRTDVPINDTVRPSPRSARARPAPASRARCRCRAAIANAFFDATGVRIREMPMTPARVRGVLAAAGK